MIYVKTLKKIESASDGVYPLSTPLCRNLDRLEFTEPVTVIVGENGSGKTTLMEILAVKLNAIRIGNDSRVKDIKAASFARADSAFRLEFSQRPRRNFFFQAEDFTRYIDEWKGMKEEAREDLDKVDRDYAGRSVFARNQAAAPFSRALYEMEQMYDGDITLKSHGESFLEFFGARLIDGGLYLLDEPEAALSYMNQFVFLNLLLEAVSRDCQIILSTHSPILPACPNAGVYQIDDGKLLRAEYDRIESIRFLRSFLNNTDSYLRRLEIKKQNGEIES